MADGVYITSGANTLIATDQVNVTGELAHVQYMKLVDGTNGSNSLISGDNVYGLDVDVTRIPSITLATQASPFSTPINVNADDVESLLTTLNTKDFATESTLTTVKNTIATISGHLDGIETSLAGTLTVDNEGTFAVQASQTGTWNVADGGSSLTVDATDLDIRNLSALQDFVTISGQLLSTIAGAVAGTEMQVDVVTLPNVTLASQASPFSSNVNVNIAATAVPMGGIQYLEGTTAALPTGTVSFGIRSNNTVRPLSIDDNDYLNVHIASGPDASLAVYSPTHDAFLCNANMMVEDADVSILNPVPIDGTVTANAGTNLNTSALALETTAVIIKNTLATISGHVDGIEGQFSTLNSTITTISGHIDGIESSLTSINTAVTDKYTPITATTNIVTSGLINASAIIVNGPSAGNHLVLYHLKGFNHGGEIRFDVKNGIGGNIIGSYTLASSGGGFNEQYNPPISLATATGLYYSYVSNAYNPNLSITAHFKTVAD